MEIDLNDMDAFKLAAKRLRRKTKATKEHVRFRSFDNSSMFVNSSLPRVTSMLTVEPYKHSERFNLLR